jgi:glycine cleavage system H protein
VELPEVGDSFPKGESFGVIESVKAASDLYMPMGGEIVEVNDALEDSPEIINKDPFGQGWLIKFEPSDPSEWDDLLSPEEYEGSVAGA